MYLEKRNRPIAYATDPIAIAIRGKKRFIHFGALGKAIRYNCGLQAKKRRRLGAFCYEGGNGIEMDIGMCEF